MTKYYNDYAEQNRDAKDAMKAGAKPILTGSVTQLDKDAILEAAWAGLRAWMDDNEVVFYQP